jgi:hypothetical protein
VTIATLPSNLISPICISSVPTCPSVAIRDGDAPLLHRRSDNTAEPMTD